MARVLVIGDTHCPAMRDDYVAFLRAQRKAWKTNVTVHIGDLVDWNMLSFHERDPASDSAGLEYKKALAQVKTLTKAFPKAVCMTGNHDCLPQRQAVANQIPSMLIKAPGKIWETPGWNWRPRYSTYDIDGVKYCHGDRGKGGIMAGLKNAKENFHSWVQGHTHSQAGVWWFANESACVFGMNTGTGVDQNKGMFYGAKYNARSIVGCGVVLEGGKEGAFFEPMQL